MRERRLLQLVLGTAIVAGVALRAWLLSNSLGTLDADEAVWGLMARHVLDGELTTFYWGQPYGGTLEVFLTAPVFAVLGSSTLALKLVDGARVRSRFRLASAAAPSASRPRRRGIFWIWPPYMVKSMRAHGYGSALVLSPLSSRVRLRDQPRAGTLRRLARAWPRLVADAAVRARCRASAVARRRATPLARALLASAPGRARRAPVARREPRHDWYPFDYAPGGGRTPPLRFHSDAAMALDLRVVRAHWPSGRSSEARAAAAPAGSFPHPRRDRPGPRSPSRRSSRGVLVHIGSPRPRYLVVLAPVLALLIAEALRRSPAAAVALAAAFALTTGLVRMEDSFRYQTHRPRRCRTTSAAARRADARRTPVRADYWVAERITFE
jgi:hypothetical protein